MHFLEGADLTAAQAAWDALDGTPERLAMRRARQLEQQRHSQAGRKAQDSERRVRQRREDPDGQLRKHWEAEQRRREDHARALSQRDAQAWARESAARDARAALYAARRLEVEHWRTVALAVLSGRAPVLSCPPPGSSRPQQRRERVDGADARHRWTGCRVRGFVIRNKGN